MFVFHFCMQFPKIGYELFEQYTYTYTEFSILLRFGFGSPNDHSWFSNTTSHHFFLSFPYYFLHRSIYPSACFQGIPNTITFLIVGPHTYVRNSLKMLFFYKFLYFLLFSIVLSVFRFDLFFSF